MGTTKRMTGRSKQRAQVNLSLSLDEAATLDSQRAQLGNITRARALKILWNHMGDSALDLVQEHQAAAEAGAQAVQPLVDAATPLLDAMTSLNRASTNRANQRRAIGVHSNQIAKLANLEKLSFTAGGPISSSVVEDLAAATEKIARQLQELAQQDAEDDRLRAELRALIQQYRISS